MMGYYGDPKGTTSISPGSTFNYTQIVTDGLSIIWRYQESSSFGFSNSDYVTLSASDTVDCPDNINVDGSIHML